MIQHQITGLGPVNADGSRKIFTRLPEPFIVTALWLEEQDKAPAVGDIIEVNGSEALKLVTEKQAISDEAAEQPDAANGEKKSPGSSASGFGSQLSPFREYQGLPVLVYAAEIKAVGQPESDGSVACSFSDESVKIATSGMTARMQPKQGDYWIISTQGLNIYEYLNPKEVFEAKYKLVEK